MAVIITHIDDGRSPSVRAGRGRLAVGDSVDLGICPHIAEGVDQGWIKAEAPKPARKPRAKRKPKQVT